ncbi:hypothetical protein IX95_22125 [Vibrio sp. B183]|nr:hypothetical protein IX95_22125 [Vibrio sp. B183]
MMKNCAPKGAPLTKKESKKYETNLFLFSVDGDSHACQPTFKKKRSEASAKPYYLSCMSDMRKARHQS